MARFLHSKTLKRNDEHIDSCFISLYGSLYAVIAKVGITQIFSLLSRSKLIAQTQKHRISIRSVETDIDENKNNGNELKSNLIIEDILIDYPSRIKQIVTVKRYEYSIFISNINNEQIFPKDRIFWNHISPQITVHFAQYYLNWILSAFYLKTAILDYFTLILITK